MSLKKEEFNTFLPWKDVGDACFEMNKCSEFLDKLVEKLAQNTSITKMDFADFIMKEKTLEYLKDTVNDDRHMMTFARNRYLQK